MYSRDDRLGIGALRLNMALDVVRVTVQKPTPKRGDEEPMTKHDAASGK